MSADVKIVAPQKAGLHTSGAIITFDELEVMDYLLMRQKVKDYAQWRAFYDAEREAREGAGIVERALYRSSDDPDDVVLFFHITDKMRAREYVFSPDIVARSEGFFEREPEVVFLI